MGISPHLLELLRCPLSGQPLVEADAETVSLLEQRRSSGALSLGVATPQITLEKPLRAALLTEDRRYAYLIDEGLPVLLPDHAISL